jgi:WD40 repeat protein
MKPLLSIAVLLWLGVVFAQSPNLDRYGDVLPPGAIARLGSLRLLCSGDVMNVVFTPDGRAVAAVLELGESQFWEVATGKAAAAPPDTSFLQADADRRRKQQQEVSRRLRAENPILTDEDVKTAVASPSGALLATSSGKQPIRVWDGQTLKELPTWPGQKEERIDSLAFSPDGKMLAATAPQFTQVWDTETGKLRHKLSGLGWQSFSSTFSHDGKTLAVADGNVVTLWDPATGAPLHDFGHTYLIGALAFAPDGKSLISGASYTDRFIHRWNPSTGERLATWRGHTGAVYALAITRDGKQAMSASYDRTCRLWDVATGRELGQIGKHGKAIWSADLAPDGRSVATVEDDKVLLWALDGKKPLRSFSLGGQRIAQVAFRPDGLHLLARTDDKPGAVSVWELNTGAEVRRLASSSGAISRFSIGPDGKVATSERSGEISLWDFETGWLTRTVTVQIGEMPRSTKWAHPEFSPDGRSFALGCSDGTIRLIEVATGHERHRFEGHKRGVTELQFSPDGSRLASGAWDRTILIWDVFSVPAAAPADLTPLWAELGGEAGSAFSAMRKLLAAGDKAVGLVAEKVHPAPATAVDAKRISALIADLDSDQFAVREKASRELGTLDEAAETALRNTLKGSPGLETKRRAEALLAKMSQPSADRLRAIRAIEVLERLATPAAKDLLRKLAAGSADASQTKDVERSLRRLDRR